MNALVLLCILALCVLPVQAFGPASTAAMQRIRFYPSKQTKTMAAQHLLRPVALFLAADAAPAAPADDPYLIHVCDSCQYEYSEEKGFKKRFPPGTRFRDLATFACPVCGAAKEQFSIKTEEDEDE